MKNNLYTCCHFQNRPAFCSFSFAKNCPFSCRAKRAFPSGETLILPGSRDSRYNIPSTKQRLDELEETKSQLEVSILQEEMHKPLLTREQIAFFIYRFRKFDVTKREQRQRLIDSFVNAVYLYEDKIILTFNYKDGSKTITLAEVESSDLSVLGAPKKNAHFGYHRQKCRWYRAFRGGFHLKFHS